MPLAVLSPLYSDALPSTNNLIVGNPWICTLTF